MINYKLPDNNVQISFSGGRTSAYMLYKILEANNGLPNKAKVIFTNTGREMEQTLDFVQECSYRWNVDIVWLEYNEINNKNTFKKVNHNSASRNGEPFKKIILKYGRLPNALQRFCTGILKIQTAQKYLKKLHWKHWQNALGIRHDEKHRAKTDFRDGFYYLTMVDWGDGSPMEYADEPLKLGFNVIVRHNYERAGIYEISGYMLRLDLDKDFEPLGVISNTKFLVRININPEREDEFEYLGGTGYSFTPTVTVDAPAGPNGERATAFATLEGDSVASITIISSGSQYTETPDVTLSGGGGSSGAATAVMSPIYYTINSSTPVTSGITTLTLAENLINTVGVGSTVFFHQQSKIIASSHTFEYIGAGNEIASATPKRGGVTIQANEVVTSNGGSVVYTSTDQSGNFRIGDDFQIDQTTGTISGRSFSKSLFSEMTPFILALS